MLIVSRMCTLVWLVTLLFSVHNGLGHITIDTINKQFENKTNQEQLKELLAIVHTYPIEQECVKDLFKAVKACMYAEKKGLLGNENKKFCSRAQDLFFEKSDQITIGSWLTSFFSKTPSVDERYLTYYGAPLSTQELLQSLKKVEDENRYKTGDVIDIATYMLLCQAHKQQQNPEISTICKKIEACWQDIIHNQSSHKLINQFTYKQLKENSHKDQAT
jgi:hypothetical protein